VEPPANPVLVDTPVLLDAKEPPDIQVLLERDTPDHKARQDTLARAELLVSLEHVEHPDNLELKDTQACLERMETMLNQIKNL
jgi:hypothetical protein